MGRTKQIEYKAKDLTGKEEIDSLEEVKTEFSANRYIPLMYVMAEMEKRGIRSSLPNLSVASAKLFPNIFSLFGYKNLPDSHRVCTTLWHLVNQKRWVKGTISQYTPTKKGREMLEKAEMVLGTPVKKINKKREVKYVRLVNDVKRTSAFLNYKSGVEITKFDLYKMLQCTLDSAPKTLIENYADLYTLAQQGEANDVVEFLDFLKQNFKEFQNA